MKRLALAVAFLVVVPTAIGQNPFSVAALDDDAKLTGGRLILAKCTQPNLRTMLQAEDNPHNTSFTMYMDKKNDPLLLLSTTHSIEDYFAGATGFNNVDTKLVRYRIGYLVIFHDPNKEPTTKELDWMNADAAPKERFKVPALHFPNKEVEGAKMVVFYFADAEFDGGQSWEANREAIKTQYIK